MCHHQHHMMQLPILYLINDTTYNDGRRLGIELYISLCTSETGLARTARQWVTQSVSSTEVYSREQHSRQREWLEPPQLQLTLVTPTWGRGGDIQGRSEYNGYYKAWLLPPIVLIPILFTRVRGIANILMMWKYYSCTIWQIFIIKFQVFRPTSCCW